MAVRTLRATDCAVIEHFVSHLLSRKVDRRVDKWVAAGKQNAPLAEGETYILRFGLRHRIQALFVCTAFTVVCAIVVWCHFFVEPLGLGLVLGFLGLILPAALLSIGCAIHAFTNRIVLSRNGLVLHRFGFTAADVAWGSVTSVRRSAVTPSIIIDTRFGKRVRVSTQMDGLCGLAELLSETPPESRDISVVNWMIEEL